MKKEKTVVPVKKEAVHKMFEHLIPYKYVEIPLEHRKYKNNPHSLQCFKMKIARDKNKKKLYDLPRVRCKNHVVEGYLYCRFHGGKVNMPVHTDKMEIEERKIPSTAQIYRNVYDLEMGNLLEAFLNDPKLLDLKPELANLRLILNNYIKKLLENPSPRSIRNFMSQVRDIIMEEDKTDDWRYKKIIELTDSQNTLTNGRAIDRINRCVESIGRTIERIKKLENNEEFLLTPEGLKVFLRAMVDLFENKVKDINLKNEIRNGLLTLSVQTKGDVSKYNSYDGKVVDAEVVEK